MNGCVEPRPDRAAAFPGEGWSKPMTCLGTGLEACVAREGAATAFGGGAPQGWRCLRRAGGASRWRVSRADASRSASGARVLQCAPTGRGRWTANRRFAALSVLMPGTADRRLWPSSPRTRVRHRRPARQLGGNLDTSPQAAGKRRTRPCPARRMTLRRRRTAADFGPNEWLVHESGSSIRPIPPASPPNGASSSRITSPTRSARGTAL